MNGARGFQNLETLFKYRLFKNAEHEFVVSAGLEIEWGGTGATGVGAEPFNVYTPTLFFGKGFGDLPSSLNWARPFAITGQIGYSIPGASKTITTSFNPDTGEQEIETEFNSRVLNWGGTLHYSMPYLKSAVVDLGLPDFINRLIPIVEASFQTPVSNTATSGTVTTGIINSRHHLCREDIPSGDRDRNPRESTKRQQRGDYRPASFLSRRPIFANNINTGRPMFGR
jgi:hypothetical protein